MKIYASMLDLAFTSLPLSLSLSLSLSHHHHPINAESLCVCVCEWEKERVYIYNILCYGNKIIIRFASATLSESVGMNTSTSSITVH